jgi:hypothetical protein
MSLLQTAEEQTAAGGFFSGIFDKAIEFHFRRDPGGRLVFLPFGPKKDAYFIDSTVDEETIRARVRRYRKALLLTSWLTFPCIYIPAVILDDFIGLSSVRHRMTIVIVNSLFVWLILGVLSVLLWTRYKADVRALTASLNTVPLDLKTQLVVVAPATTRQKRVALALVAAGLALVAAGVFAATRYSHPKPCPPDGAPTSTVK